MSPLVPTVPDWLGVKASSSALTDGGQCRLGGRGRSPRLYDGTAHPWKLRDVRGISRASAPAGWYHGKPSRERRRRTHLVGSQKGSLHRPVSRRWDLPRPWPSCFKDSRRPCAGHRDVRHLSIRRPSRSAPRARPAISNAGPLPTSASAQRGHLVLAAVSARRGVGRSDHRVGGHSRAPATGVEIVTDEDVVRVATAIEPLVV